MTAFRRRPVPLEWREDHHRLDTRSHAWGSGFRRTSRTTGYCSCGMRWPRKAGPGETQADNLNYADVVEYWNDHVQEMYYALSEWDS